MESCFPGQRPLRWGQLCVIQLKGEVRWLWTKNKFDLYGTQCEKIWETFFNKSSNEEAIDANFDTHKKKKKKVELKH